jgi:hypothetical protein
MPDQPQPSRFLAEAAERRTFFAEQRRNRRAARIYGILCVKAIALTCLLCSAIVVPLAFASVTIFFDLLGAFVRVPEPVAGFLGTLKAWLSSSNPNQAWESPGQSPLRVWSEPSGSGCRSEPCSEGPE